MRRTPAAAPAIDGRALRWAAPGVIDRFLEVFTRYIDSGFGLLQGEVKWLAGVLIAIDLVLAALFWAMAPDEDVIARLVKKTLFIGVFAYIINQLDQPRPDRVRELRGAGSEGLRHGPFGSRTSSGPAASLRSGSTPASQFWTRSRD